MADASFDLVKTMASTLFLLCMFSAMARLSAAEVYKVGDSAGWTIGGRTNYTTWASTKSFHVGDTILFEYNKQFHNVLHVSKADYHACNTASPIETYASGKDSISIKKMGHYFYICGFPGHCGLGQRVDIRIAKTDSAPTPSAAPSLAPAPGPSSGQSTLKGLGFALAGVGVAAICSLFMP